MGIAWEIPFPLTEVLAFRPDSSTGIGQIYPITAIEALNSYFKKTIYNTDSWEDKREVWYALQDDYYNINMIALVLKYKEKITTDESKKYSVRAIMAAYNGTGYWAERYGDVTLQYYLAFKAYNSRENCGLE